MTGSDGSTSNGSTTNDSTAQDSTAPDSSKLAPVTYLFGGGTGSVEPELSATGDSEPWQLESSQLESSEPAAPRLARVPRFTDLFPSELAGEAEREAAAGNSNTDAEPDDADSADYVPTAEELADELAGETDRAHNIALHALARKGVSTSEMTKLLESRDLDEHIVDAEIARLEAVGLLDDAALAETLVRTLQERKGLGRSGVTNELRRRGIDQSAISLALEADDDQDDEAARALEVALKRASQLRSYDTETAKRRLSGFLMRRGYSGQVVSAAVNAALESTGSSSKPSYRSKPSGGSSSGPRFR